ncbi:unnamed protein product [Caenorhabditis angaria]|uniref:Uncharacterized protein n=1 Tax=Caenorhabditis angaria TaxID=860376 RepID=A0A9P1IK21_9PELO|nr:unnamed protein product [Caenorhabditis angaria]
MFSIVEHFSACWVGTERRFCHLHTRNRVFCIRWIENRIVMMYNQLGNYQTERFAPAISTKPPANQSYSRNRIPVILFKAEEMPSLMRVFDDLRLAQFIKYETTAENDM